MGCPFHGHATPRPWCGSCKRWYEQGPRGDRFRGRHGSPPGFQVTAQSPGRPQAKVTAQSVKVQLPCVHLGEPTGELVQCSSCQGSRLKTFACTKHVTCVLDKTATGVKSCADCSDRLPRWKKHLLYHVYPLAGNGVWQRQCLQLLKRINLFDGKRIVAVVTGPGTDSPDAVKRVLGEQVGEWIVLPNNPDLREVVTLAPLLERVQTDARDEALFWGHAKGVTYPASPGVPMHRWAEMLYELNLDYWPVAVEMLTRFLIVGAFKKIVRGFPESQRSAWHYSGSFFWARCRDLFSRNWRDIDQIKHGVESTPGSWFLPGEAGCLFHEQVGQFNLYDPTYLTTVVEPAFASWKLTNKDRRAWQ